MEPRWPVRDGSNEPGSLDPACPARGAEDGAHESRANLVPSLLARRGLTFRPLSRPRGRASSYESVEASSTMRSPPLRAGQRTSLADSSGVVEPTIWTHRVTWSALAGSLAGLWVWTASQGTSTCSRSLERA